jgi:hypothetical protein
MLREERTRSALRLKDGLAALESHGGEELGVVGRDGVVRLGGQHRSGPNCEYKSLGCCWREVERVSSLIW